MKLCMQLVNTLSFPLYSLKYEKMQHLTNWATLDFVQVNAHRSHQTEKQECVLCIHMSSWNLDITCKN